MARPHHHHHHRRPVLGALWLLLLLLPLLPLLAVFAAHGAHAFIIPGPPPRSATRRPAAAGNHHGNGPPPFLTDVDALGQDIYDQARPPPLIITIGPQCGGKTSLLRRLNATRPAGAPPLLDVAIDDDRDVYRRVPMRAFLDGELGGPRDVRIRGRLASERCGDPAPEECRLVLGFLAGLWPLEEVERRLAAAPSTVCTLIYLLTETNTSTA